MLLTLPSCTKDETLESAPVFSARGVETRIVTPDDEHEPIGQTVLGRKLQNPYSLRTMQRAAGNLNMIMPPSYNGFSVSQMATTHFYVKFKPQTEDELAQLKQDTTLVLYDYPLDYEILKAGLSYHDPAIPDSLPTYQYASVPIYKWRQILMKLTVPYEVLESLYIPDEEKFLIVDGRATDLPAERMVMKDWTSIEMLVDEALRITGNEEPTLPTIRAGKWRPAGKIMYESESLGLIGLRGVEVRARRWFTTHKDVTDSEGVYECDGRFKRPANYFIRWERYNFAIRKSSSSVAVYDGPKKRGNWNLTISKKSNPRNYYYATIFRAAHHYYYKDICGLHRPPLNSFWKTQLKIRAYNEADGSVYGTTKPARRFLGMGSMIKIYSPERPEMEIYGTTIHELAHAAHWGLYKSDYNNASSFVLESWARGVQHYLTRQLYPNFTTDFGVCAYTGIVVDLIDKAGILKSCGGYYLKVNGDWKWHFYLDSNGKNIQKYYFDRVTGYTLAQIESALNGARTAKQWETNLTKLDNETNKYLPITFTFWSVK